jgi:hypothetical protein
VTVEVLPKANGNTLVTAFSDQAPLPFDPAAVAPEPAEINRLQAICERLSLAFGADKIIARQACFRPVTQDGLPCSAVCRISRAFTWPRAITSGASSTHRPRAKLWES